MLVHILIIWGGGGVGDMAPKRKQVSQLMEKSKWTRKTAQGSQQVPAQNHALQVTEDLCGCMGRLEEHLGAVAPPGPSHHQE